MEHPDVRLADRDWTRQPTPCGIGVLPSGSTSHRGGVNICDIGNFFHSPQGSGEVVFIVVC